MTGAAGAAGATGAAALAAEEPVGLISEEEWAAHRREVTQSLPPVLAGESLPSVLLDYQQELLSTIAANDVTVCEKSRRTGATWALGAQGVLTSGASRSAGGMDTLYIGYNLDMAREFVDACAMWARAFLPAATAVGECLFYDKDEKGAERHIHAFRIAFASGFEVVALSSRPRSLRGRQGLLIIDEAAFHDDLEAVLKAGLAFLVWGGRVVVISTHNTADNPFNDVVEEIRAKKKPYALVRFTFDDALSAGLYQRICLVRGEDWSAEGEAQWRSNIRAYYGSGAAEELDCVPSQSGGTYLPLNLINAAMTEEYRFVAWKPPAGLVDWPEKLRHDAADEWCEQELAPLLADLPRRHRHFFGGDCGRKTDRSTIAALYEDDLLVRRFAFVVELSECPFDVQARIIWYVADRLPRFGHAILDANGIGMMLAEAARQRYGPQYITELSPSNAWYLANMPPFRASFEDKSIVLPRHVDVRDDLRMIELSNGVAKVPPDKRRTGSDGILRHGDAAMAIVYGHAAADMPVAEYAYQPAPLPRPMDERGGDDDGGPLGSRMGRAGGSGLARMRGAF